MLEDDLCNIPGKLYIFQDVEADLGMSFDETEFNVGQCTGLAQDFLGQRNFPDIMDVSCHFDSVNLI